MRDYFRPFLLGKDNAGLSDAVTPEGDTLNKIKTHGLWALAASGIGFACWKAGQWYAGYQIAKKKSVE